MDELRDALSAAYDKVEEKEPVDGLEQRDVPDQSDEATPANSNAGDSVAQEGSAAERARDEQGRFAKAEEAKRETLTLKGKKDAPKEQERRADNRGHNKGDAQVLAKGGEAAEGEGAQVPQGAQGNQAGNGAAVQSEPILPPQHWNGRGKIEFERLPYHVKQTLVEEYQSVAELRNLAPVLEPVKQILSNEFGGVDRGLGAILGTWNFARTQPIDFAKQFLARYNIDPQTLIGAPSGVPPQAGEDTPQYVTREELAAIQARERQEAQAAAAAQQINSDISSFGSATNPDGTLAYPYFNDVRPKMAGLMMAGAAKTLKEAYEMAVYADPATRTSILAAEQAKQAAERRRQAEQARGAAVSIAGAPGHRGPGMPQNETVGDTLTRAWEKAVSGARA